MSIFRNQLSEKAVKGRLMRYRKNMEKEPEQFKYEMTKLTGMCVKFGSRIPGSIESAKEKHKEMEKKDPNDPEERKELFNLFKAFVEENLQVDVSGVEDL